MVIFLQLCLFLIAVAIRGRYLFGKHLSAGSVPNQLNYIAKSKYGRISGRHIGIIQHNGIPFIVKRERWYHRILKGIGIASEIKIPNADFDQKYFIITDYPSHLEMTMASGKLFSHLQELFSLPVKSLHAVPHKMWCVIGKEDLSESDVHYAKHIELLSAISQCTNKAESHEYGVVQRRNLGIIAFIFICVHAGLLTLGVLGVFPTFADSVDIIHTNTWIVKGILAGSIAAVVWFLLILRFFRQSSWICWVFADFVLCGIVGFILSGVFMVREANVHLPQASPSVFEQPILQKICVLECRKSCGRHCTRRSSYTYQSDACNPELRAENMRQKKQTDYICQANAGYSYSIHVQHWKGDSRYSFTPSIALFDQVREGSYLRVPVHAGALGLEWVDTKQIQPE